MGESKAPLVDSGMIQVALALSVVGFVFSEVDSGLSDVATLLFVFGGFATIGLMAVYMGEWVGLHSSELSSRESVILWFAWTVLVSYAVLCFGLGYSFGTAILRLDWPGWVTFVAVLYLLVAFVILLWLWRGR